MIELIAGVVTDIDSHILLARSRKHGWWELPGTKLNDVWATPENALSAAFYLKLGLQAVASERAMPQVVTIEETIGGVDFTADVRRVLSYEGYAMETQNSGYSEIAWWNPMQRRLLGRITLSPIAERFFEPFKDDPFWLQPLE